MATLTLIMPVYNAGAYLDDTLKAVEPLTGDSRVSMVIVNDGSTDNSREVIKRLTENMPRVTYIEMANRGVSAARNTAIERAEGDYLWFVDADDLIHASAAKVLLNETTEDGADMIWTAYRQVTAGITSAPKGGVK